ncbi:MAG: hypothetical protein A2Y62_09655 [Candidatus Fischerbacteria bacterium RBG_13_37_8]|uniref:Initiation factor 2B n=1 Tax=Candidatus Fischerbacteria bacterium RBG_13_37_8 TaxID=1817863 RepID=A0A1F5V5T2_9BACT|nr:MAG: hypothetical protein A2Y62_09655 [Candidatus Fischerbacteria bacterium RBG_13_37_8]
MKNKKKNIIEQEENDAIAVLAHPLVSLHNTVGIYSYDTAVVHLMKKYLNEFKDKEIHCSECRPEKKGLSLAKKLSNIGYKVHLYTDMGFLSHLHKLDVVITGADFIIKKGVVNTIGTSSIGALCRSMKKPFYVLLGSSKFLPGHNILSKRFELQSKDEIIIDSPKIKTLNYYSDITPFKNITYIVTEKRLYTPKDIIQYLKNFP